MQLNTTPKKTGADLSSLVAAVAVFPNAAEKTQGGSPESKPPHYRKRTKQ